jgi:hypothetical protein
LQDVLGNAGKLTVENVGEDMIWCGRDTEDNRCFEKSSLNILRGSLGDYSLGNGMTIFPV